MMAKSGLVPVRTGIARRINDGRVPGRAFCGVLLSALGWEVISHAIMIGVDFVGGCSDAQGI
jgi:hypothetical protein